MGESRMHYDDAWRGRVDLARPGWTDGPHPFGPKTMARTHPRSTADPRSMGDFNRGGLHGTDRRDDCGVAGLSYAAFVTKSDRPSGSFASRKCQIPKQQR